MSLINEALRKARQEAAREQARSKGITMPLDWGTGPRRRPSAPFLAAVATLLLTAVVLGAFLAGGRKAVDPGPAPAQPEAPVASAAPEPPPGTSGAARGGPIAALPGRGGPALDGEAGSSRGAAAGGTRQEQPEPGPAIGPRTAEARPRARPTTATRTAPRVAPEEDSGLVPEPTIAAASGDGPEVDRRTAEAGPAVEPRAPGETPTPPDEPASFHRQADLAEQGSYRLDGIAWSSQRPFALVNGQVVGPGASVDGARVVRVEPDQVLLAIDDRRFVLRLR